MKIVISLLIASMSSLAFVQDAQWYRVSANTVITPFTIRIDLDWFIIIGNSVWFDQEPYEYSWVDEVSGSIDQPGLQSPPPWTSYYHWLSNIEAFDEEYAYSYDYHSFGYYRFAPGMWIGPDELYTAWIDYKGVMNAGDDFWFYGAQEQWELRFPDQTFVLDEASRSTFRELNATFHELVEYLPPPPAPDVG